MTIREHAEAIVSQHAASRHNPNWCQRCGENWPCDDFRHAQAILDALDAAQTVNKTGAGMLLKMVFDPPVDACRRGDAT